MFVSAIDVNAFEALESVDEVTPGNLLIVGVLGKLALAIRGADQMGGILLPEGKEPFYISNLNSRTTLSLKLVPKFKIGAAKELSSEGDENIGQVWLATDGFWLKVSAAPGIASKPFFNLKNANMYDFVSSGHCFEKVELYGVDQADDEFLLWSN